MKINFIFSCQIDFYRERHLHHSIDATQKVNDVFRQSIDWIEKSRQRLTEKSLEPTSSTKPMANPLSAESKRLSSNFLFVYQSVTSVLRDHGLI